MDIAVYAICYNEEYMLPFFLQHYKTFANSITIYDNHSTDGSVHIMNQAGVNVEYFESDNTIRDDIMLQVKNTFWKKSIGLHDWVIVVDIDEFVYHHDLKKFFKKMQDKTLLIPHGFNMFANTLPEPSQGQIYKQAKYGVPNPMYSKPCIFNPNRIKETNFTIGCHSSFPSGEVVPHQEPDLKLLHYDYLTLDFRIKKCLGRGRRISKLNKLNSWGTQYMQTEQEIADDYHSMRERIERIVWTTDPVRAIML